MDLQLDTATGDLEFSDDNDLILIDGVDAIRQHITIRLQFFQAEWFLDERIGIPYYQEILRKAPDLNVVRSIFREAILTTPGVIAVTDLVTEYDGTTRTLTVSFSAQTEEGPLVYDQELIIPTPG
jgi:hypothetical protein